MELNPRSGTLPANAALGIAYFGLAAATVSSTRFGGGVACLWIATALLLSALSIAPRRRWPAMLATCAGASALATGMFGVGWLAAAPLAAINVGEAALGAALLRLSGPHDDALDSLGELALFVAIAGIAAPLAGSIPGAAVVSAVTGSPFPANWWNWLAGHALGTISFAPVFTMLVGGSARQWLARSSPARRLEGAALLALVLVTSLAVFSNQSRPLLFLPILPVIMTTFRIGRLGAAAAVVIVALVGGTLTLAGHGPVHLMAGDAADRAQFFQFYLAATVLTALPVAADLARRRDVLQRLRAKEAQLRLLTENSTDIVMDLGEDGTIRYASPSIAQLGGYSPEEVIGRNALELVASEDREKVTAAHRAALRSPEATQIVEYRAVTADGTLRWFETHTRGVIDAEGRVTGVVSAVRDVSHRKSIEAELERVAATDPLTGLANRRAFNDELSRALAGRGADGLFGHLAVFDLDHFKAVNDLHGHAVGDEVLRSFAKIARASVRDGDMVARLGGEEFGVILRDSAPEQARLVCERVRAALAASSLRVGVATVRVTASAGIAPIRTGATDTVAIADAALYRAKDAGRNRLRLAA